MEFEAVTRGGGASHKPVLQYVKSPPASPRRLQSQRGPYSVATYSSTHLAYTRPINSSLMRLPLLKAGGNTLVKAHLSKETPFYFCLSRNEISNLFHVPLINQMAFLHLTNTVDRRRICVILSSEI